MTREDMIAKMAKEAGISKAAADKAMRSFTTNVTKAVKKGDKFTLVGFGTFYAQKRAARKGRNPQTGETIRIPAAKVPKFKPGKALKDAVKK
ncbi:MAG: HU family DNA-binding protein [Gemmatimonadota bacterium]|nr:MAG: HU family DNA-binding protein [Gemmatimonadota bacterium]